MQVNGSLADLHKGSGGMAPVAGYGALFLVGLTVGLGMLAVYEQWLHSRPAPVAPRGPGAATRGEVTASPFAVSHWSSARRLSLLIAVGIGLHNFGEGLAIGASAAAGAVSLATVLVIGFGLHNATEGFGIVAPLAAEGDRPSWGFLMAMGFIGGAPTFIGTAIGRQFASEALSVLFLTLAGGSILYVVLQLIGIAAKQRARAILYAGVLTGLAAGFITDMVVTAGGG